jgi:hypothetical protein
MTRNMASVAFDQALATLRQRFLAERLLFAMMFLQRSTLNVQHDVWTTNDIGSWHRWRRVGSRGDDAGRRTAIT